MDILATIILIGVILYQGFINWNDRKSARKTIDGLYDRIMAENFAQYALGKKRLAEKPDKPKTSKERKAETKAYIQDQDAFPVD